MASPFAIRYVHPPDDGSYLPPLLIQYTLMKDSILVWLGITDVPERDTLQTAELGRLASDWACAMSPKSPGTPSSGTSLFCASQSSVALPMAQRLATKFKKQFFLSLDLTLNYPTTTQDHSLLLHAERSLINVLKDTL